MESVFSDTVSRVQQNTDEQVNTRIKEQTLDNISNYKNKSKSEIINRIKELDQSGILRGCLKLMRREQ